MTPTKVPARVKFPWRVFSRLVLLQACVVVIAFAVTALAARHFFAREFSSHLRVQLQTTALLLSHDLNFMEDSAIPAWCSTRTAGTPYRVSVMTLSGVIICDTLRPSGSEPITSVTETLPGRRLELQVALESEPLRASLHLFDTSLFAVLLIVAGGLCVFTFFSSRRLVVPLGELILKAEEVSPADGELPDPGEWVELESALDRIQSDLKQKTDTLSQEREELATLMGAISDAILAVDPQGKPLFFNTRFALLFFDKDSKDRQPRLGEIFRSPEVLAAFRGALDQGQPQEAQLQLYVKSDPVPRYFALSVAPLRPETGPVYGAVGIFHDVTELKRAEKIRIEFVANVSHELRTPLTAIKGYADTLKDDLARKQTESAGKFVEIIVRNVDRLMNLISDLLDLSSLESSESADKFQKSTVDTRELTTRVLTQLETRRSGKQHEIETHFDAPSVDADPGRVEQVLVNLLENAFKYVPAGKKVTISWESVKGATLLRVADNGLGIPPEHLPRLFERFYRVDPGRARESGGTGLGLAIVKHIMQRHGGSVWVSSEPGKGTTFFCQFPVA